MIVTFKLNQLGVTFKQAAINSDNSIFDLTNSTTRIFRFQKPGGFEITKTATIDGAATLGRITYSNDDPETSILDKVGKWKYRGELTMTDNDFIPLDWVEFEVN